MFGKAIGVQRQVLSLVNVFPSTPPWKQRGTPATDGRATRRRAWSAPDRYPTEHQTERNGPISRYYSITSVLNRRAYVAAWRSISARIIHRLTCPSSLSFAVSRTEQCNTLPTYLLSHAINRSLRYVINRPQFKHTRQITKRKCSRTGARNNIWLIH